MREDGFEAGDFERSLAAVAQFWAIGLIYVGIDRPIDVGPVSLHLTLLTFTAPFLLVRLERLRRTAGTAGAMPLGAALALGVSSYVSGIFWGDVARLFALGLMIGGVIAFETAMLRIAGRHEALELERRWVILRRATAVASTCWVVAAVIVLGGFVLAEWLEVTLVVAVAVVAGFLLHRLAKATRQTRSWASASKLAM